MISPEGGSQKSTRITDTNPVSVVRFHQRGGIQKTQELPIQTLLQLFDFTRLTLSSKDGSRMCHTEAGEPRSLELASYPARSCFDWPTRRASHLASFAPFQLRTTRAKPANTERTTVTPPCETRHCKELLRKSKLYRGRGNAH